LYVTHRVNRVQFPARNYHFSKEIILLVSNQW
jgi:hypothetical protein